MPSQRSSIFILAISIVLTGCTHARVIGDAISPFHSDRVLWTVQTNEKAIAITIDDSPDARETPLILEVQGLGQSVAIHFRGLA